jgi:hypothetical protein
MYCMKNKIIISAVTVAVIASALLMAGTAFAQSVNASPRAWVGGIGHGTMKPVVFGTVASVNGNTLTVTSKNFGMRPESSSGNTTPIPTPTTYTVDATNATVMKNNATSTVSNIAVGDTVVVQGTVSGTSVTATMIRDGVVPMMGRGMGMKGKPGMGGHASSTPSAFIPGNGQPVIGGTVSAVSGSTLTVKTANGGVTYTVDAASAIVVKGNATSTVSAITVGDRVVVQGSVSGTSVSAYSVSDSGVAPAASTTGPKGMGGVFGAIGGFFKHIFGFF